MAIVKTTIGAFFDAPKIKAYLDRVLVPKYADEIILTGSGVASDFYKMEFMRNGKKFFEIAQSAVHEISLAAHINDIVSESAVTIGNVNNGYPATNYGTCNGYEAENGVVLAFGKYDSSTSLADRWNLVFTHDNFGETVTIRPRASWTGNSSTGITSFTTTFCIARRDEAQTTTHYATFDINAGFEATVLTQFPVPSADGNVRYTPNAFFTPFSQYTSKICKLYIDGVLYLNLCGWAIRAQ